MMIVGHYDAHGALTSATVGRALRQDKRVSVIVQYPDTGPRMLSKFIEQKFDLLKDDDVLILDIPVDVTDPEGFISAINRLASTTRVTIIDHHGTTTKYRANILADIIVFDDTVTMNRYLIERFDIPAEDWKLLYVASVADRDPGILREVPLKEVLRDLLPLANKADVLVRDDVQAFVDAIIENGVDYLATVSVEYPPERLAQKLAVVRRSGPLLLLDVVDTFSDRELGAWFPKTVEYLLQTTSAEYAVVPRIVYDPRRKDKAYGVAMIQWWLGKGIEPEKVVRAILPDRTIYGHERYVVVPARDLGEAVSLAEQLFKGLSGYSTQQYVPS